MLVLFTHVAPDCSPVCSHLWIYIVFRDFAPEKNALTEHDVPVEFKVGEKCDAPDVRSLLCQLCPQTELLFRCGRCMLHFLTSCPKYNTLRQKHFANISQIYPEFESISDTQKLPYVLGEMPKCEIIAAKYVFSCHEMRTTSGTSDG